MVKCSYVQHGSLKWKCPYPVMDEDSDLCIFHAPLELKDSDQFYKFLKPVAEVAAQLDINSSDYSTEQIGVLEIALENKGCFCGFIFPDGVSFHKCSFKDANFSYAKFRGDVQFWDVVFTNYAKFHQVQFDCNKVSFDSSYFLDGFSFSGASFNSIKGVSFHKISCDGNEASFIGATFSGSDVLIDCVRINTSAINFSRMNVSCDGIFHLSGDMCAERHISFEQTDFFSPVHILSNLTSPNINMENIRFQEAENKGFQQSKISCRIESSNETIWDKISCATTHELLLCKSRFVGNHYFTDCEYSKINMSSCVVDKNADVLFQSCDMANIHFSKVDLTRIRFLACSWPRRGQVAFIADDPTKGGEIKGGYSHFWRLVLLIRNRKKLPQTWIDQVQKRLSESERLYRQLKVQYDFMGEPALAGDFYLREMQMKSKQLGYLNSFPLGVYNLLSCFGESWVRAGLFLLLIWATGSLFFMIGESESNFFLDALKSMLLLKRDGLWGTTMLNIIGPVQTTLLAFALKRRFKR